jgi:hypothetical protein
MTCTSDKKRKLQSTLLNRSPGVPLKGITLLHFTECGKKQLMLAEVEE